MLALAGIKAPAQMQGRNLIPLIEKNRPSNWRTDFFYEHHFGKSIIPPSEGVRNQRWSYIRWTAQNPVVEELYDIRYDPLQVYNLVKKPEQQRNLNQLRARYRHFLKALD